MVHNLQAAADIHHFCVIFRYFLYDFLYLVLDNVVIVIHHHNFTFRDGFDVFNLIVVQKERLIVHFPK